MREATPPRCTPPRGSESGLTLTAAYPDCHPRRPRPLCEGYIAILFPSEGVRVWAHTDRCIPRLPPPPPQATARGLHRHLVPLRGAARDARADAAVGGAVHGAQGPHPGGPVRLTV